MFWESAVRLSEYIEESNTIIYIQILQFSP